MRQRRIPTYILFGGLIGATAWGSAIRLAAAAAIGAVASGVLARWLLDVLARDPDGLTIVPPLRSELEPGPPWLGAPVLVAACVVVVVSSGLRYRRLPVHRLLRDGPSRDHEPQIGEV